MDAFLLLAGLSAFLVGSLIFLLETYRRDTRMGVVSTIMPLLSIMFYWDEPWRKQTPVYFQVGGLLAAVTGALLLWQSSDGMLPLLHNSADDYWHLAQGSGKPFVESDVSTLTTLSNDRNRMAKGKVHAQDFFYDRADYLDGVLRLRQGGQVIADRELALALNVPLPQILSGRTFYFTPEQQQVPVITLSWRDANTGLPETLSIGRGYRLELRLSKKEREGFVDGYVSLLLPDNERSYVIGEFIASTTHLQYNGDDVDATVPNADTVAWVVREHIKQRVGSRIREVNVDEVQMNQEQTRATASTRLQLDNSQRSYPMQLERKDEGPWRVVDDGLSALASSIAQENQTRLGKTLDTEARSPVATRAEQNKSSQGSVAPGAMVRVTRSNGSVTEGRLLQRTEGVLVVQTEVGGGVLEVRIPETDVAAIVPASSPNKPAHIRSGSQDAASGQTSSGQAVSGQAVSGQTTAGQYASYLNHRVRVQTASGREETGVFRGMDKNRLVIEIQVGSGVVNHFVAQADVVSISAK